MGQIYLVIARIQRGCWTHFTCHVADPCSDLRCDLQDGSFGVLAVLSGLSGAGGARLRTESTRSFLLPCASLATPDSGVCPRAGSCPADRICPSPARGAGRTFSVTTGGLQANKPQKLKGRGTLFLLSSVLTEEAEGSLVEAAQERQGLQARKA